MTDELYESIVLAPTMDFTHRQELVQKRLKELVAFAKESSPFYRDLYRNIDSRNFVLADLPPVDKSTISTHFEYLLTDRSVDPNDIRNFVRNPENIGVKYRNDYSVVTTSGTSGDPLIVLRDSFHNRVHGLLLEKRLFCEMEPEKMTPEKSRIAVVIAGRSMCSSYSSFVKLQRAFPDYQQNTRAFDISGSVDEMITGLNEFQPDILTGYPSIMLILAERQISGQLAISPQAVACSAETLTDSTFQKIKEAFSGVVVMNNYCTTEAGEIAMTCPHGHLHLNDDWVILEAVDENNRPVPPGTISDRVLVTDLSNRIMPVLRYRLEDRVCFSKEPCSCGSTLPVITVCGRGSDTLSFHGIHLPSVFFAVIMYEQSNILSWQFAQTAESIIEFRAVYIESTREKMKDWVKQRFTRFLEEHNCSDVQLILSDELPRNSQRGGKLKQVVKEYP